MFDHYISESVNDKTAKKKMIKELVEFWEKRKLDNLGKKKRKGKKQNYQFPSIADWDPKTSTEIFISWCTYEGEDLKRKPKTEKFLRGNLKKWSDFDREIDLAPNDINPMGRWIIYFNTNDDSKFKGGLGWLYIDAYDDNGIDGYYKGWAAQIEEHVTPPFPLKGKEFRAHFKSLIESKKVIKKLGKSYNKILVDGTDKGGYWRIKGRENAMAQFLKDLKKLMKN